MHATFKSTHNFAGFRAWSARSAMMCASWAVGTQCLSVTSRSDIIISYSAYAMSSFELKVLCLYCDRNAWILASAYTLQLQSHQSIHQKHRWQHIECMYGDFTYTFNSIILLSMQLVAHTITLMLMNRSGQQLRWWWRRWRWKLSYQCTSFGACKLLTFSI